ncbi:MAG: glycosyltransferase family 2 protein [Saprospiraceae bacterium]|nr:glycosyltransferase family 2 protein [Saprospiraceae bacterium]
MSKISGVIITLNEESCIQKCIESLLPVCDEIVVLDSHSVDETESICKRLGVRFFQQKFVGYGQQKNAAVALAQHNYILSLDADEFLSKELIQEILKEKNVGLKAIYSMPRLNNYCGHWVKHCGWYPDRKIRLWHRAKARWEDKDVHEKVIPIATDLTEMKLKGDILHHTYTDIADHLQRIEYYTDLQSIQMFKAGKKYNRLKKFASSVFRFIYIYLIRLGFLDGKAGWNIAQFSALNQFLKYDKLENLYLSTNSRTK